MGKSKLPHDFIELGRKYGLAGKRVYIPKNEPQDFVARYKPAILMDIEKAYEERGLTFL